MDPVQIAIGLLLLLLVLLGAAVVQAFMLAGEPEGPPPEPSASMVEDLIAGCIALVRRAEETS